MDPRHLFADARLTGNCVYCGGVPNTQDHCPSKVLLDEPLPPQLAVVDACESCNQGFSKDELYVACLIESVVCGSAAPHDVSRPKIRRLLEENSALASALGAGQHKDSMGNLTWDIDVARVRNVLLKLARGHIAYELSLPQLDEPDRFDFAPFALLSGEQRSAFESPIPEFTGWPEVGSRAFIRASKAFAGAGSYPWIVVQPGRYRYLVDQSDGNFVQIVLSEYLACRIGWS
jgi:hypothetical protein